MSKPVPARDQSGKIVGTATEAPNGGIAVTITDPDFSAQLSGYHVDGFSIHTPVRYLSRPEVAARIGVKPDTLNRYKLPDPDAQIGARQLGWLPATIDAWNAARPGTRGPTRRPDPVE